MGSREGDCCFVYKALHRHPLIAEVFPIFREDITRNNVTCQPLLAGSYLLEPFHLVPGGDVALQVQINPTLVFLQCCDFGASTLWGC